MNEYERIKEIMNKYNLNAKKSFGQNFLISEGIIKKIIISFDYSKYKDVIEIGPGLGALTIPLSKKIKHLIAIDSDRDMINVLKNVIENKEVELIESDFLKVDINSLSSQERLIIGNLPYNITSRFLEYVLKKGFKSLGIMIQKEVANKLEFIPNKKENTPTGLFLALGYSITNICDVDSSCFYPAPKVDSCFIRIDSLKKIDYNFLNIFKIVFKDNNKSIRNNLRQSKIFNQKVDSITDDRLLNIFALRGRQLKVEDAIYLVKELSRL